MINEEKVSSDISSYLKKLDFYVSKNASFSFFNYKFVDKTRIDDILCCIEASFPEEYKNYLRKKGSKALIGYSAYIEMITTIRKAKSLSSSTYLINYTLLQKQITHFKSSLRFDFKKIAEQ